MLRPLTLICAFLCISYVVGKKDEDKCNPNKTQANCQDGIMLPLWTPIGDDMGMGDRVGRGLIYFICLFYLFLGVSIVSDRFMASIEVITAQEREVTVKKPDGSIFTVTVRVWNETVSNLTLMALGSSAPEIMLSVIEVVGKGFKSGELGPNTIVGSAAFNLFMIIGICVWVIPAGEVRRQQHLTVFFVTASWSIFAYVWLYLIVAVISPAEIEIWEGILTFVFFPITVLTAYVADRRLIPFKFLSKRYTASRGNKSIKAYEGGEAEMNAVDGLLPVSDGNIDPAIKEFEDTRNEFMSIFRDLRKQHPNADIETLQEMCEEEMIARAPKSRAFYRVQATRRLTGGGNIVKKKLEKEHNKSLEALAAREAEKEAYSAKIAFDPAHYTVLENVGKFQVTISRTGGPPDLTCMVDYHTEDGSANAGSDYIGVKGTLTFHPGEKHQTIEIEIIDDDVFEEDEHFYVHLENLRVKTRDGLIIDPSRLGGLAVAELVQPPTATVMILDDDHAGVFMFEHETYEVNESAGHINLKVLSLGYYGWLTGGGNIVKKKLEKEHNKSLEALAAREAEKEAYSAKIAFDPAHYTVLENVGKFQVTISRTGGPPDLTCMVDYHTEDGSANAGSDYIGVKGTLTFHPGEKHQTIEIEIIDDDVFEEDEHFYVHLENLRVKTRDGLIIDPSRLGGLAVAELVQPPTATVMILDDDHAGVFMFEHETYEVNESAGHINLKVMRSSGARGKVLIPFKTVDGTAISPKDYEGNEGHIEFDNDEIEKYIQIGVIDDEEYEKNEFFTVSLGEPIWAKKLSDQTKVIERYKRRQRRNLAQQQENETRSLNSEADDSKAEELEKDMDMDEEIADLGRPRLGEYKEVTIRIRESKEFKGVVDKMIKTANVSLVVGSSSWKEQFLEAFSVSAGDDDDGKDADDDEKEEPLPGVSDYVMHFVCVPWKILFALIPPTDYLNGWVCFVVSILAIGMLTAAIGDFASHFGCYIGLKDLVTAISFVAPGTSVPDTFASKVAAVQDKYADSSIGNVTGSNGVNVFLGIGIAWTLAAIYHAVQGTKDGFEVEPGSLAYSVVIFCVEAFLCIVVLCIRRLPFIGGELGGPMKWRYPTIMFMVVLWLTYVILSALENYCVIDGF